MHVFCRTGDDSIRIEGESDRLCRVYRQQDAVLGKLRNYAADRLHLRLRDLRSHGDACRVRILTQVARIYDTDLIAYAQVARDRRLFISDKRYRKALSCNSQLVVLDLCYGTFKNKFFFYVRTQDHFIGMHLAHALVIADLNSISLIKAVLISEAVSRFLFRLDLKSPFIIFDRDLPLYRIDQCSGNGSGLGLAACSQHRNKKTSKQNNDRCPDTSIHVISSAVIFPNFSLISDYQPYFRILGHSNYTLLLSHNVRSLLCVKPNLAISCKLCYYTRARKLYMSQ